MDKNSTVQSQSSELGEKNRSLLKVRAYPADNNMVFQVDASGNQSRNHSAIGSDFNDSFASDVSTIYHSEAQLQKIPHRQVSRLSVIMSVRLWNFKDGGS